MSKPGFWGWMDKHIIKTIAPFIKTWGHGTGSGFLHGVSLDVKMLSIVDFIIVSTNFLLKFRYKLKQGLLDDHLSGQLKYPSITMTLSGGRDIATSVPVA